MIEIRSWLNNTLIHRDAEAWTLGEALQFSAALNGAHFPYANLAGANLRHVHLAGANLENANLENANLAGANLRHVNLAGANLRHVHLENANLENANLACANLAGANLPYANLAGANLRHVHLAGANLACANLAGANLPYANLACANLENAFLPGPASIFLASWGELSPQLCGDMMHYDAANHPSPAAFELWVIGGPCPYEDVRLCRVAYFRENKDHWSLGRDCRPYDLMVRVLTEKCPDWSAEQQVDFLKQFEWKGNK